MHFKEMPLEMFRHFNFSKPALRIPLKFGREGYNIGTYDISTFTQTFFHMPNITLKDYMDICSWPTISHIFWYLLMADYFSYILISADGWLFIFHIYWYLLMADYFSYILISAHDWLFLIYSDICSWLTISHIFWYILMADYFSYIISRRRRRPGDGRYCNAPRPSRLVFALELKNALLYFL